MDDGNLGLIDEEKQQKGQPRMRAKRSRKKAPARKRFDRAFGTRLSKEEGRGDILRYLAGKLHTSMSYVSRLLDNKTPRRFHTGRDMNMWARLKALLTPEEIRILEEMESE